MLLASTTGVANMILSLPLYCMGGFTIRALVIQICRFWIHLAEGNYHRHIAGLGFLHPYMNDGLF